VIGGIIIGVVVTGAIVLAFCAGVTVGTKSAKEQMERELGDTLKNVRDKLRNN